MLLDVGLELKSDLNRWVEGVRGKRERGTRRTKRTEGGGRAVGILF